MRKSLLFLVICLACQPKHDSIEGNWQVESKFYKATCKIVSTGQYYDGIVLSYDDGTSKYQYSSEQPQYFFRHLAKKGSTYVDGMTGATRSQQSDNQWSIVLVSMDTLKVQTKISNRKSEELWVRK